jgi:hypothetical protein
MNYKSINTQKNSVPEAVAELKSQLKDFNPGLILFFASSSYPAQEISKAMKGGFSQADVIGCSTSGEIASGKMFDNGISGLAFSKNAIADLKIEVCCNICSDKNPVSCAFDSFEKHFGKSMADLDPSKYIGIVLIDGISGQEEVINDKIGNLTNINFIGGSAGDDLKFRNTYVYHNGEVYTEAALLAVLKPTGKFSILKTQSFKSTGKVLKVTRTNEKNREIIELNGKPAVKAYAEALNVPEEKLSDHLFKNPLGLMFSETEPFVRSPRVIEKDSVLFYCSVKEGMELNLLNSTDIIKDTAKALEEKKKELGGISAIVNFNCILRTLDLKQQNRTQEYADLFKSVPTAGFSTYGESYIGHINQTATMLVFKD